MPKKYISIVILILFNLSCVDVIDVEVPSENPRLVIDALIRVDSSLDLIDVKIKATESASFFDNIQPAILSEITILNIDLPSNNSYVLTASTDELGMYEASIPKDFFIEGRLVLNILYNNETYVSITSYIPAPDIDNIEQSIASVFGQDQTELEISFTDLQNRDDYYLFDFDFNEFITVEDEFFKNQQFVFSYFYEDRLEVGKNIDIKISGISVEFFDYLNQIIAQSGQTQGPFQTPAGTVLGNIINITNTNFNSIETLESITPNTNFPLGYFAVCETFTKTITIE
ncbi:MAG: DUF4249 domain-containing protein [Cellulophaga sp.]|nr:DUF4249 domain-containing protein [Cellulophaga sp.]